MTASSVATFLDVTQPANAAARPAGTQTDPKSTTQAAAVLAAINEGAQELDDIREKSGLAIADTVGALSWLERAGLITLTQSEGSLRAELTPAAIAALR
jgi:predicted Rossmann fold nucleotide-binding protein DprA/Smf involved in DNA uptake